MAHPISPLAPTSYATLPPIRGARLAAGHSGIRYKDRDDVLVMAFDPGTTVAGLLTQSSMPGAPVDWCRDKLPAGKARALVVNAGIANVFTGKAGIAACKVTAAAAAKMLGCKPDDIMLASTGVIGQILPGEKLAACVTGLGASLAPDLWRRAAETIKTTDTFPKLATATAKIDGKTVTINGICKGSGMIAPAMATMLAFIVTDAALPASVLRALLKATNDTSFNCLTVDGDTSTSDTLLCFATGAAGNKPVSRATDPRLAGFKRALDQVAADLAQQIARDGEGAQKLVTINVTGAANDPAARRIALAVANSPLVKTAIAGADANWGRIIMAVGKSGEKADRDKLVIALGGRKVTRKGMVRPDHDEAAATEHFKSRDVRIDLDVGVGGGRAKVWTCDLTHGYIDINADYRS